MPGVCTSAEPLRDPRHELLDNSAQDMQIKKDPGLEYIHYQGLSLY